MRIFKKGEVNTLVLVVAGLLVGIAVFAALYRIGIISAKSLGEIYDNLYGVLYDLLKNKICRSIGC